MTRLLISVSFTVVSLRLDSSRTRRYRNVKFQDLASDTLDTTRGANLGPTNWGLTRMLRCVSFKK